METKRKLFEKDYTYLVQKVFGREPRNCKEEDIDRAYLAEEKFVIKVGCEEIDKICNEIEKFVENTRDLVVAEDIVDYLEAQAIRLKKVKRLLLWNIDPISIITKKGSGYYKQMVKYRRDLMNKLLEVYEGGNLQRS